MSGSSQQTALSEEDYSAIQSAVMETSRGRWFLAEYARRNRNADTASVLEAIGRLESALEGGSPGGDMKRVRFDIVDMATAIARAKAEIGSIKSDDPDNGRIGDATNELDAIVKSTEIATGDILAAAEHLQEVAWSLREAGVDGAACHIIDQRATDIYTACSFQDITGQRTRKVIEVLRYLEDRLNAMIAILGLEGAVPATAVRSTSPLLNGPALPGEGLEQSDVDAMMAFSVRANPAPEALPLPVPVFADALPLEPLPLESAVVSGGMFPPAASAGRPDMLAAAEPVPAPAGDGLRRRPREAMESPFTEPVRPKPKARVEAPAGDEAAQQTPTKPAPKPLVIDARPVRPALVPGGIVTLADIEALPFEEKAALFS